MAKWIFHAQEIKSRGGRIGGGSEIKQQEQNDGESLVMRGWNEMQRSWKILRWEGDTGAALFVHLSENGWKQMTNKKMESKVSSLLLWNLIQAMKIPSISVLYVLKIESNQLHCRMWHIEDQIYICFCFQWAVIKHTITSKRRGERALKNKKNKHS